ncbi:MAG: hypothetical protein KA604_00775 [Candidatus Saccharimonas sp.]|jgi:ADP-ribose pyrophosphatase YjhB (NUDIX family)/predicted transcriptional regulator|nr:hypothetical protein [Candidatus Saccharimonas sp.]
MEYNIKLHAAQASVLHTLRHATRARYGELRKPTGLESDIFKYHLGKLLKTHYIVKAEDGLYELTAEGKEFANRLDEKNGREIEQPKPSMLLVISSERDGITYYLGHRRTREPFRDFWGIGSAPVLRGVTICDSAVREVKKQTGLTIKPEIVGFFRVIDRSDRGRVLEDKLFALLYASVDNCPQPIYWYGGESVWLTRSELLAKPKLFPTTKAALDMAENRTSFAETTCIYCIDEY